MPHIWLLTNPQAMSPSPSASLPIPDTLELARSAELIAVLDKRLNGSMRFDEYMAACLYEPGLGYYSSSSEKFGAQGDFVTAPMLSPLFGACLGRQCVQWLVQLQESGNSGSDGLLEFGAGNGMLAAQILLELERSSIHCNYTIIELSADLQMRQRATIAALAPHLASNVRWLNEMPKKFKGVILANELLDALPVRLFRFDDKRRLFERRVSYSNKQFQFISEAADPHFQAAVAVSIARSGSQPDDLSSFESEYPEQALAWISTVADAMDTGVIVLLDYGFPASEFYHPQRSQGTLNCHYRHYSHADPFYLPGLQDITAHVDFSAIVEAAQAADMALLGYTSQANFLLNLGILDRLAQLVEDPQYPRFSQAVGKLLSEAEMGELFKAVAFAKLPADVAEFSSQGFASADRSHRL
jgi:SAM-dependent MidA family methyltransferase